MSEIKIGTEWSAIIYGGILAIIGLAICLGVGIGGRITAARLVSDPAKWPQTSPVRFKVLEDTHTFEWEGVFHRDGESGRIENARLVKITG